MREIHRKEMWPKLCLERGSVAVRDWLASKREDLSRTRFRITPMLRGQADRDLDLRETFAEVRGSVTATVHFWAICYQDKTLRTKRGMGGVAALTSVMPLEDEKDDADLVDDVYAFIRRTPFP